MSYKLEKPYTDIQRADFICEHQGLNYYEDDNCIIMYANTEKIVNGEAVDISQTPKYIAEQKLKTETKLFTEARECVEKLLTYKLLYPAQANTYQNTIDARYLKLDADLAELDGE